MSKALYKAFLKTDKVVEQLKFYAGFPVKVYHIRDIINKPSYYPEMQRKSKKEMWMDNFLWLVKYRELNRFYTSYGLDVVGLRNSSDFMDYRSFVALRNAGNQGEKLTISGRYNYIVQLRDKYIFAAYLASTIGEKYVVPTYALITDGKAFLNRENRWTNISELLTDGSSMVYKVLDGECADGVMLVNVSGNHVEADGSTYTKDEFVNSVSGKKIIVQNVVSQHDTLQNFKTKSVNTLRIVTIRGKSGAINVFAAFLRLSASPDSFVDNRAKGGLGIGIDLETGKLMKYGFPHDSFGVKLEVHPLSGIRFDGFQLPYWDETVELVRNAHKQFYELESIGWDVVITNDGPVLLEGNDDWELGGPQDTYGGLKKRWFELTQRL